MKIDLTKLITDNNIIYIDEDVIIDNEYFKNTDIKNIKDLHVNGHISPSGNDYEISLNIKCTLILICSISLNEVPYNIDININEIISIDNENIEENNKIINNSIDLIPIIWQNIILEVPLKVVDPNIHVKNIDGDGWRFITDEKDIKNNNEIAEKLKEFLGEQGKE